MICEAGSRRHDKIMYFVHRGPLCRNDNKVRMTAGYFLVCSFSVKEN